jgi:hypothetical protein
MVLQFRYEPLRVVVNKVNNEESGTYYYGWIINMISKKTEYLQWIVAAKLWYIMMVLEPCR